MLSLAQILAASVHKNGAYTYTVSEDWSQGRTLYGGLVAALANVAMRSLVADKPLRALQLVFVGPNAVGDVHFEPTILRAGKSVTLAACTAKSNREVTATLTAMYGSGRDSKLRIHPNPATLLTPPSEVEDVSFKVGLPSFTLHYHQRWARGQYPYTRATSSDMSVYVRYREEGIESLTEAHALALMDAIPSPALAMLDTPGPASTLSWTLEFLDSRFDFAPEEWWRIDASVDAAQDGYVVHSSHVLNPEGRIAAISRQVVVVYG